MLSEIQEKLQAPFNPNEIEWRVQQAGESNGKVWCMVLAYVDARALQKRLDDVFGVFGWEDKYEPLGDDFICTLTATIDGKTVSKQNGASKTQVEGFKGGISNSFKRVCASGFGIGRYLYDLDTVFAEVSMEKQNGSDWVMQSYKSKTTNQYVKYWYKKPSLPDFAKPKISKEKVEEIENLIKETSTDKNTLLAYFKISSLTQMSEDTYGLAKAMLEKKKGK